MYSLDQYLLRTSYTPVAMFNTRDTKKEGNILSSRGLQSMQFIGIPYIADFCTSLSNMDGDINLPDLRLRRNSGAEMGETVYSTSIRVLLYQNLDIYECLLNPCVFILSFSTLN